MNTTVGDTYFQTALVQRRDLLLRTGAVGSDAEIGRLLAQVDAALARLDRGTFGMCSTCHDHIEADRLVRDPLAEHCADHPGADEAARVRRDLAFAREIQRRLLPPVSATLDGWRYTYRYEAAGDVGGDFCDVIPRPALGELLILIGDVSGKGVAASMLMSHLLGTFRSLAPLGLPAGELLARVNDLFHDSVPSTTYATLAVAALRRDRTADLYSAGHWTPLVRTTGGTSRLPVTSGLPLGMFPGSRYQPRPVSLGRDDTILFFTDGAIDAESDNGGNFGAERLAEAFGSGGADVDQAIDRVLHDIRGYQSASVPQDDLLLFGVAPAA